MDYSQFLIMRGEISLLLVFLLIFLFDTFGGKKSLKGLSITACVLFALHTVWNIIPVDSATAFGGYDSVSFLLIAIKAAIGNDAVSSPIKNSKKCPDETIKYIPNKVTNNNS